MSCPIPAPTPEFCFLWIDWWPLCMTKAEWSGWAQAIGAMLALTIAIAVPAKARSDARKDAKAAVLAFMSSTTLALEGLRDVCMVQDWDSFVAARHLVQDAALAGDFLFSVPLDWNTRGDAMTIRAGALEAFHLSAQHTEKDDWGILYARIGGIAAGARLLMNKVKSL